MRHLRLAMAVALAVVGMVCVKAGRADDEVSPWKTVAGKWGGNSAPGGAVWKLTVWPGRDEVWASVMANGIWMSADGGENWKRMGEPGKTPANGVKGAAIQFVFDPKNADTMWTSGMYGWGVWRTTDHGKTFVQLGTNTHVDGMGVDLTDPEHKTLLIGLHEQVNSLHKSSDGGATWEKIGDNVPKGTNFTSDPIVLDAKTYLTNCAGWGHDNTPQQNRYSYGIYRTEDGGKTWNKVNGEFGPSGNATITSKGDIFWPVLWDGSIIKSSDKGKTWGRIGGPARGILLEMPGGALVGLGGNGQTQLFVSKDDGKTWKPFGEPVPFDTPRGIVYDAVRRSLFAWRDDVIVRWDWPADVESAYTPKSPKLVVWDGAGHSGGSGWGPGGKCFVTPAAEHFKGTKSLEFHIEGTESSEGGWNWFSWAQVDLTDIRGFDTVSFNVKVMGDKPAEVKVCLNCGPNKVSSKAVDVAKYCADYADGKWHTVSVPLHDLEEGSKFDPRNTYEVRVLTKESKEAKFSVYLDAVKFTGK